MRVRVDESRQQHAATQIDDSRPLADVIGYACFGADIDDAVGSHGYRFGPGLLVSTV